jgi:hypothetical protein
MLLGTKYYQKKGSWGKNYFATRLSGTKQDLLADILLAEIVLAKIIWLHYYGKNLLSRHLKPKY